MIKSRCRVCKSNKGFKEYEISFNRDNNLCSLYVCTNCFVLYNPTLEDQNLTLKDFESMQGEVVQNYYAAKHPSIEELKTEVEKNHGILDYLFDNRLLANHEAFIDIGSGAGILAAAAASRFKRVYASDLDTSLSRQTATTLNLKNIFILDNFELIPEKVDVAVLWHTLEHIHDPADFIFKIKKILKYDGLIFIQVPLYRKDYFIDSHLWFFNAATLSVIKEVYGFEKLTVSFDPANSYLTFCLSNPVA